MIIVWIITPMMAQFFHPNIDINNVWSPFYSPKLQELDRTVRSMPDIPKIGKRLIINPVIKFCQV
jgi:hypothetical protein